MNLTLIVVGIVLAAGASYFAFRTSLLDRTGAVAATVLGAVTFGLGGWQWAILLLAFFYTSSTLSKTFKERKTKQAGDYSKGDRRDAGQVAANGAVAGVFAAAHAVAPSSVWPWIAFAGALAAANADTWATELGVLAESAPRLITNLRKLVPPGSSGGVSAAGTLASLGGSVLIGLCAVVLEQSTGWSGALAIALGGLVGSVIDSVLGATVQAMYYCPQDKRETERHPLHSCGAPTTLVRGWTWFTNDWVNAVCTAVGALAAWGVWAALRLA